MKHNCFQRESNFFGQKEGMGMGNPLLLFLANLSKKKQQTKYISIPHHNITKKLGKYFKETNFSVRPQSRSMPDLLSNPKDKVD